MKITPQLTTELQNGDIIFFDYHDSRDIELLKEKKAGKVDFFIKDEAGKQYNDLGELKGYVNYYDIRHSECEVCFFDNEAIKTLFVGFPSYPQYYLVRLRLSLVWFFGIIGLLRRIIKGTVGFRGIITTEAGTVTQRWVLLEKTLILDTQKPKLGISEDVGIQGLIDFCNTEKLEYVVLRNFQNLPELHRKRGDLDILASDFDTKKIVAFIQKHAGDIPIDVWPVSLPLYRDVPYYPPHLAQAILDSARDHSSGAKIPGVQELLCSFAYHAVYHKGALAGIPATTPGVHFTSLPENDYLGDVQAFAQEAGVHVGETMEEIDAYLEQENWRPKLDTLVKLGGGNTWIKNYFFSNTENPDEMGLGMFLCREAIVQSGKMADMIQVIEGQGFLVLEQKILSEAQKRIAKEHLRGGVWAVGDTVNPLEFPAAALVVVDAVMIAREKPRYAMRLRELKYLLRAQFTVDDVSPVHSTDNTKESLEYLQELLPETYNDIYQKVTEMRKAKRPVTVSFTLRYALLQQDVKFAVQNTKKKVKDTIIGGVFR